MNRIDEDTIGYRIRIARCSINLTQKQLADEVGVGSNYIATVERGKKNPSEELVHRIAAATHTTTKWISGISENQTAYPESDGSAEQVNANSASIAYLVDIIRNECAKKDWEIAEPTLQNEFPKTDWLPDYWFYLKNGPIRQWAFDLSLCVYSRPDFFSKDGIMSPKLAFANFISNVLFSNPLTKSETKFTFVVPTAEIFSKLLKEIKIPIGNFSILQIDINEKKAVQEKYLCNEGAYHDYLEETLRF